MLSHEVYFSCYDFESIEKILRSPPPPFNVGPLQNSRFVDENKQVTLFGVGRCLAQRVQFTSVRLKKNTLHNETVSTLLSLIAVLV